MFRRQMALAAVVFALVLAASPVAAAEPGMAVAVGGYHLVGRVVVNVDVTLTCQPKPEDSYPSVYQWGTTGGMESPSVVVQLRQAQGRHQAYAEATEYLSPDAVCTGAPHTMTIALVPDPSGPAFRVGAAAASVSAYASYYEINYETSQWTDVPQTYQSGWLAVRVTK